MPSLYWSCLFHDEHWKCVSVKGRPGVILGSPCSFSESTAFEFHTMHFLYRFVALCIPSCAAAFCRLYSIRCWWDTNRVSSPRIRPRKHFAQVQWADCAGAIKTSPATLTIRLVLLILRLLAVWTRFPTSAVTCFDARAMCFPWQCSIQRPVLSLFLRTLFVKSGVGQFGYDLLKGLILEIKRFCHIVSSMFPFVFPIKAGMIFPQTVWPHYGVLTVREKHLV